jgi:pimeloyl-ACP methyl ester carboxylesterase
MNKIIPKIIGGLLNILTPLFPKFTRNKAFNLLCRVKRIPISEEGQIFFSKGETHWLDVVGYKTALHKWGDGPKKILFMHGWMSHSQRWKQYVESMDLNEFTCYALDAPGHGASEGNFLNLEIYRVAYMEALEITGPVHVLVSHSFGNLVAGYQYLYNPKVPVASYVIMGSPSGMDAIFKYFEDILGLSPRMLKNLSIKINKVLKLPIEELSMRNFFNKLESPALLIHEETDKITPIAPMKEAASEAKRIEVHYTSGLDHTLKSPEILKIVKNYIYKHTKTELNVLERI